jgi:pyridoxine 4-dehydrogenase
MSEPISAAQAGTVTFGDLTANRIGLGTNRITDTPDAHYILKSAVELGINFIDTAHVYASGESEVSIGNTLAPYSNGLVIATKGGMGRGASPQQLRRELEESLRKLKTDCIDLYQLHRVDANTPLEESMEALKSFQKEGLIRHIGLSEVTVEQLQRALQVAPVVSVQNQYNVVDRQYEAVVDFCTRRKIVFIPWSPLGGLRGGASVVEQHVAAIAHNLEVSPRQVALKWLLQRSPMMLPIPGTLSLAHLEENLRTSTIELSEADYAALTKEGK